MKENGASALSDGAIVTAELFGDTVYTDVSEEFVLPDYEPEISRILRCTARVLPAGKFIGGGRAEFAGSVVYELVYAGDGGACASAVLSSDYEFAVPMGAEGDVAVYEEPEPDTVICRPTAPRRVQFRTKLKSRINLFAGMPLPHCDAPEGTELLTTSAVGCRVRRFTSGEFSLTEMLSGITGKPIACDGSVSVSEMRAEEGRIHCRGELWARILFGGEMLSCMEKRIPFEREIEAPGLDGGWSCRALPRCWSCEISGDTGNGEATLTAVAEIDAECCRNLPVRLTVDAFIPGSDAAAERDRTELADCRVCRSFSVTVSGSKPLTPEAAGITEVCGVCGDVSLGTPELSGGHASFSGTLTLYGILCGNNGSGGEALPLRMEIPFKAVCDAEGDAKNANLCGAWSASLIGARFRVERGTVSCDAEVAVTARVAEKRTVQTLCSVVRGETQEKPDYYGMKVVYPAPDETLWQIAKRYGTPLARVIQLNRLGTDVAESPDNTHSLDGIAALLIG